MRIDRIEVSGGFLDGLRLAFKSGLNVLIGARGAGKTSVLELIRYALAVPAMTSEAASAAQQQARAVLGDGTVTVYCSVQGEQLLFSRTALDDSPATSAAYNYMAPLIVSQNEIEAIGLDPRSRREILDRLIDPMDWGEIASERHEAAIASLERRLERLRDEREQFLDRAARLDGLDELLAEAEGEQQRVAAAVAQTAPLQKSIAKQSDELGRVRAAADGYRLAEEALAEWREALSAQTLDRPIPRLQSAAVMAEVNSAISRARTQLAQAVTEITAAEELVARERADSRATQTKMQRTLKADAEQLEELQRGAGEVGRRVSALRQQLKERDAHVARAEQLGREIAKVVKQRDDALDESEGRSGARYELRKERAAALTTQFHGRVEVRVDKSGEYGAYESALVRALEGSNLRYKSLAASLAQKVSPRELVAAVEAVDPDRIARDAGISRDRAVRLVAHLQEQSVADLLLAPLDDAVDFALLDGQTYKSTRNLSMGQRCTVVLPLLLAEPRESILLDQPEDHLDNAFIVETLVQAIRDRAANGQVIIATHNANVPVLGEAQQVIVLASNGRHCFVTLAAPLEDTQAVQAITSLMEGGREAFERRAAFYDAHDND